MDDDDKHSLHNMDTNGYTGHDELFEKAQKRLLKTAIAYCEHVASGEHTACDGMLCPFHIGLIHAHRAFSTT